MTRDSIQRFMKPVAGWSRAYRRWALCAAVVGACAITNSLAGQVFRSERPIDSVVTATLQRAGFEPAEAEVQTGRILFAIENRAGVDEVDLSIQRVRTGRAPERLSEKRSRRSKRAWSEIMDLPVGEYEIRGASRPNWVFRLTVSPRRGRGAVN